MHYSDLLIHQIALRLSGEIFGLLKGRRKPDNQKIINQVIESSESIDSNIIEGWSRRFYPKEYIRFLEMSLGSSDETQGHVLRLFNRSIIDDKERDRFFKEYKDLSIRILNFIDYHKKKNHIII
jgi:four helix bundle protein